MPHPTVFVHNVSSLYTLNPKFVSETNPLGLLKNASIGFVDDKISFIGDSSSSEAIEGKHSAGVVIDEAASLGCLGLWTATHSVGGFKG